MAAEWDSRSWPSALNKARGAQVPHRLPSADLTATRDVGRTPARETTPAPASVPLASIIDTASSSRGLLYEPYDEEPA